MADSVIKAAFITAKMPLAASLWPILGLTLFSSFSLAILFRSSNKVTYSANKQRVVMGTFVIQGP